ncbi:MAG: helix-turn-helix domain-containing protein [Bdellovibrionales bacterium]|nr:helix-turn-helix domain-containing protein [Bdellovibrionales bacterium]
MEKEYFVKIPRRIARNFEISPQAKALYMALRSYDPIFPSYHQLCKDTGIKSKTSISKFLKELVFFNLITIIKSGFNRSNTYKIVERPFNGLFNQDLNSSTTNIEPNQVHDLDSNKINIIISNKANEAPSVLMTEDPLAKHLNTEETSEAISKILKEMH